MYWRQKGWKYVYSFRYDVNEILPCTIQIRFRNDHVFFMLEYVFAHDHVVETSC